MGPMGPVKQMGPVWKTSHSIVLRFSRAFHGMAGKRNYECHIIRTFYVKKRDSANYNTCFELGNDVSALLFSDERRLNLLRFQFIHMDGERNESVLKDAIHERCIALRKRPVLKS